MPRLVALSSCLVLISLFFSGPVYAGPVDTDPVDTLQKCCPGGYNYNSKESNSGFQCVQALGGDPAYNFAKPSCPDITQCQPDGYCHPYAVNSNNPRNNQPCCVYGNELGDWLKDFNTCRDISNPENPRDYKFDCGSGGVCNQDGKCNTPSTGVNVNYQPVTPNITPTSPSCKNGKDTNGNPCTNAGGLGCWSSNGQPALGDGDGVITAIGCIPTEPTILVQNFLKFATGIGGAIALLLMISGAFQMITSQGNPETVKKGQEQFTSAVIGLLFIILSVLLLEIIGVDILKIPGLGK